MTWAVKAKLPTHEKFLLLMMANYADSSGKCWPSIRTLSLETGLSKSTIHRSIKTLVEMGLPKVEARTFKGKTISNVYKLQVNTPC
jgi:DNA-binding MarR family transcriptional regulator